MPRLPITASLIAAALAAAPAGAAPKPVTLQYLTAAGEMTSTKVLPSDVAIIGRNATMTKVCVETAALGRVWAAADLWMVESSGGERVASAAPSRVGGKANGFGTIREIPVTQSCA